MAMHDAIAMGKAMQKAKSLDDALKIYNVDAVIRAKNLYDRSR